MSRESLEEINTYFDDVREHRKKKEKPCWSDYFISMAFLASARSEDFQTQHGCVITDRKNRVLGIGYNSFPHSMPDDKLPNVRPHKYKWMVHAERNALSNCTLRPENGIAYITGPPCFDCAKSLYQEGISKFVCVDGHGTHLNQPEDDVLLSVLIKYGKIEIEWSNKNFQKTLKNLLKT